MPTGSLSCWGCCSSLQMPYCHIDWNLLHYLKRSQVLHWCQADTIEELPGNKHFYSQVKLKRNKLDKLVHLITAPNTIPNDNTDIMSDMTSKIIMDLILFPSLMKALVNCLSCSSSLMIVCSLISFPSLMRALLNGLSCSSSSMMVCSPHSIFLLISFILLSLFICLMWLVSPNFFAMASALSLMAFFWLSNTFAFSATCWLWLSTMVSCFVTGSLFCWGCCSSFQRPNLKLITLSEKKHPGAKCYIDVSLTPLRNILDAR